MSRNSRLQTSALSTRQSCELPSRNERRYLLMVVALVAFALVTQAPRNADVLSSGRPAAGMRVNTAHTASDADMLAEVSQRLLAVVDSHPDNVAWPPPIRLASENDLNAYATIEGDWQQNGQWKPRLDSNGRFIPYVVVDKRLMNDVIQGDADRLAMVVGHELSHILLGHVLPNSLASKARTKTFEIIFTSEQEHDADISGIKLALASGYAYKGARGVWDVWNSDSFKSKYPGINYTSFESVGLDHPSWTDRLSYMDKEKANIWKAMSAFENGALFLSIEQYSAAEEAFFRVINEFPDNYEGWANLGYARLMLYLDAFDALDLRRYDIGQIVTGSFYLRPEELRIGVRGVNAKVWEKAVSALKKALELKPNLSLARANLGVAYLLSPTGRDAKTGSELLEQAVTLLDSDKNLDNFNRGAVLVNAAAADLANGQSELSQRRLDQAKSFVQDDRSLSGASDYNRALLALRAGTGGERSATKESELRYASTLLVHFLETTTPKSLWWDLGYERYVQLMTQQRLKPRLKDDLTKATVVSLRPIPSVEIEPGALVTLSDRTEDVRSKFKTLTVVPIVVNTINVLHHPASGADLLAGRRIVAIFLHGPTAPTLKIQPLGIGAKPTTLSIGAWAKDVEKMLGTECVLAPLNDPAVQYYFYPQLGVGVRYGSQKRVTEMILAQIAVQQ